MTEPAKTEQAPPIRYHSAAIALHWAIAMLLAYQFALGLRLEDKAPPPQAFTAFQQHKSIGIAILVLSLGRLLLRLTKPRPAELGGAMERLGAKLTHFAFYIVMLVGPLTGWILVSSSKIKVPTLLFGLVPLPHLPVSAGTHEPAELAHAVLGWALPALFLLHFTGVIYHWRQRDPVPGRMFPAGMGIGAGIGAGLTGLLFAAWLGRSGPLPQLWSSLTAPASVTPTATETGIAPTPEPATEAASTQPPASDEPSLAASETATQAAVVASCDWIIDPGSRLGFVANYSGSPVNGTFRKWDAKIHFCEDEPASGSIAANVSLASADTADASRDENLHGPAFFDTAAFPQARFAAKGFKSTGAGRYNADGTLTLRGKSQPVRLTFTLRITGDKALAQGNARLSRLAFGVGTDEWAATDEIADAVAVSFTIQARRK